MSSMALGVKQHLQQQHDDQAKQGRVRSPRHPALRRYVVRVQQRYVQRRAWPWHT